MESSLKTVKELGLPNKKCLFCLREDDNEFKYGKFYVHGKIVAHYYCLLFASALLQQGRDDEGILGFLVPDLKNELNRGQKAVCYYCKKKGATVGCCDKKCHKSFHLLCGMDNGSLHQFYGTFKSYCIRHRPSQKVCVSGDGQHVRRRTGKTKYPTKTNTCSTSCPICLEDIQAKASPEVLWAPCCKRSAFFHRDCLQRLALNAGYFFRCPLCNNQDKFKRAMLYYGIYIPLQDASWEREPNAFQELLERHSTCDAKPCYCPKGRKYDGEGSRWELLFCSCCGSQGIHIACGGLNWNTNQWTCQVCTVDIEPDDGLVLRLSPAQEIPTSPAARTQPVKTEPNVRGPESDVEIDVDGDVDSDSENEAPVVPTPQPVPIERSPARPSPRAVARRGRGRGQARTSRRAPYRPALLEDGSQSRITDFFGENITSSCSTSRSSETSLSVLRSKANNLRYFIAPGSQEVQVSSCVRRYDLFSHKYEHQ